MLGGKHALRRDFLASIVVFLVALPLCLGIAIASGAPPMAGLITGIIGGIVVGALAGQPLQVSGPAAGLVALVYEIIVSHGMKGLGMIVLLAGLMQVGAGILKLGQWFRAISPAVIQGMLAGIGILIVASQFHVLLDVSPESSGLANILSIPETIRKGLFPTNDASHHWAAMVGVTTLSVVLLWNLLPKRFQVIPGTLAAVIVGVVMAALTQVPIKYVDLPGEIFSAISFPDASSLALLGDMQIWVMAITIAVIASAETMLSSAAVDRMQNKYRTKCDQEMLAQGVGNTLCGFFGGLPMTGVIVRSTANIHSGAETRLSAILHGIWLLALISFFPALLEKIPTASLAAVLVYTGYKLVNMDTIKKLWKVGPSEVAIYLVTVTMVVATNLLEGVIAGMILAVFKLLYQLSKLEGYSLSNSEGRLDLFLKGSCTFLSMPRLLTILDQQPTGKELHIHVEHLAHIDHACMEQFQSFERIYETTGGKVIVEWQALADRLSTLPSHTPSPV